ncbi:dehydroquinate synthase/iron-containing alcohol dehydrogenase family protein [Streptomyces olivochromogenes]|uniref:iron-containing alcohol dehydrogenase n=1 Tax=Streptomyces olivochromogenes TaxID=1963 RepID=UPI00368AFE5B
MTVRRAAHRRGRGITADREKTTGRAASVAPRAVLYDPLLLSILPAATAVPSALNALAHAEEALYAPDRTPVTDLLAAEALRSLAHSSSAPAALQDLGLRSVDFDEAAELTLAGHLPGPAPVSAASVRALLHRAWSGAPPGAV